jgi:hypothetical protein
MKTIKEAKCKYCEKTASSPTMLKTDIIEQNMNAFDAGVEFAQRWIPIEEELPKSGSDLLLVKWLDKKNNVKYGLAKYLDFHSIGLHKNKYLDFIIQGSCPREVTHWRPIELK